MSDRDQRLREIRQRLEDYVMGEQEDGYGPVALPETPILHQLMDDLVSAAASPSMSAWIAGLTDAKLAHAWREGLPSLWKTPATLEGPLPLTPHVAAFRAALLALVPKEEAPSRLSQSWLPDTFIERAYQEAQQQQIASDLIVVLSAAEASAIRRRVALPPSPGAGAAGGVP